MRLPSGYLLVAALLAFAGCSKRQDAEPFRGDERYVRIYADILIEERRAEILHQDSTLLAKWKDSLFVRSGVNPKEYEEAITSAKSSLENWKEFNQRVAHRLEELQREISVGKDTVRHIPKTEGPPVNPPSSRKLK